MICNNLLACIKEELLEKHYSCVNQEKCVVVADKRSNIKCEENRKIYNLENTNNEMVVLYQMDGGVIEEDGTVPSNTCKCDYLFVTENNKAILTELKGVEVGHALDQIEGTLNIYKRAFGECKEVYGRIIVSSATPRLSASPKYTRLQMKLKKMNGNLKVKENRFSEKMEHLQKE